MLNTNSELTELLRQYVITTINMNIDNARKQHQQHTSNNKLVEHNENLVAR
jgi:hypothetical protein